MTDFFDQISSVLSETAKKHPGQLQNCDAVKEFFMSGKKPDRLAAKTAAADGTVRKSSIGGKCGTLDELKKVIEVCKNCPLANTRKNIVFGEGNPNAALMFIGEAPGYEEDACGKPFVGKAGQLLDRMISAMQFSREEVYIANIVKCHPDGNRNPSPDEIGTCMHFLRKQIDIIRPEVIVALGAVAAKALLATENGISKLRGKWCSFENIPVMPTFHPAFLLRQESAKKEAWQDLQMVMARFGRKAKK